VEKVSPEVWDALENVIKDHPVLLNRAPTLHRLSIQAFEPILVEGRAIKLHPLVCAAFNADFDGDQMPIHVPLSSEAQAEARFLMLSANNFLKPADGQAVTVPSQDMVLGSYYLTIDRAGEPGEGGMFRDFDEAMMAYANGVLGLHAPIKVRVSKVIDGVEYSGVIDATLGRLIFNQPIPQDLGFVDRPSIDEYLNEKDPVKAKEILKKILSLEIDFTTAKKHLKQIVDRTIKLHGPMMTAEVLDAIKANGFKYCTKASISISVSDMTVPEQKQVLIEEAQKKVEKIARDFRRGLLSEEERYKAVVAVWEQTTKEVTDALQACLNRYNPIKMMSDSGARGSLSQMRQLAGMRGLMFSTSGKTMEIPIKSNFREGLNVLEYFIGARGSRKSLSDTALKTADSGYLTRRLVDVSQEVIIRVDDCGTKEGIWVSDITDKNEMIEPLTDRLTGRFAIGDIVDPNNGEVIVHDDELITLAQAKHVVAAGITKAHVRSILKCKCKYGVCAHCYGVDLATSKKVSVGEAVGIIAAQSIGEPGTQLTMRNFHTGGIATSADITQGLPRVEELFEARRPKKAATLAEETGFVRIVDAKRTKNIVLKSSETGEEKTYPIPYGTKILVEDGSYVTAGDSLTEGNSAPADIANIKSKGIAAAYDYITREVQRVYRMQDIEINDKHIEVIERQMTRKIKVDDSGDTNMLVGSVVDITDFNDENDKIQRMIDAGDKTVRPATGTPMLLGITKAALQTDSFLSAASFQETTKVLTEAAIKGKIDHLLGLKENVIIGKLIPAGTGLQCYRDVDVHRVDASPAVDDDSTDPIAVSD
ncbi:MAG: DNA-directed RNA polymerase subunit beta', partial [Clostridia bacterium]|nr:DNA-directed RNA polymerase subunit beta' [Clostridia bacterium]